MKTITRPERLGAASMAGIEPFTMTQVAAVAQIGLDLQFILHAVFCSEETEQAQSADPHAFVKDASAPAAIVLQNIRHAARFWSALVAGPLDDEAFNAQGTSLGITLQDWIAAKGSVHISPPRDGAKIDCRFTQLRPYDAYNHPSCAHFCVFGAASCSAHVCRGDARFDERPRRRV